MKILTLKRQYRNALSKDNAMHVFQDLFFKYSAKHQTNDKHVVCKVKKDGFVLLRKLKQYAAANEILKINL